MIRNNFLLLVIAVCSCQVSERPIEYGSDECDYCKMMIMDQRYGSELVTEKGKVYTFDAAECLIEYLQYNTELTETAKFLLVTPYTDPNHLMDARDATYLISKNMASPMGAYLTAFRDPSTAERFRSDRGGVLYTWEELYGNFKAIRFKAIQDFE